MPKHRGFTLIEVMITVAIVAILSVIAVPSYTQYIIRGKITEATSTLSDLRIRMEQYYQDNRMYGTGGVCGVAMPASATTAVPGNPVKHFTMSCVSSNAGGAGDQNYVVTATGGVAGGDGSMAGFTYTVNHANAKATSAAPAGWAAAAMPQNCWITSKGGKC
jgi:type IV pilus assembly protein PilE